MGRFIVQRTALAFAAATLATTMPIGPAFAQAPGGAAVSPVIMTRYHTTKVAGIDIFYREAGPADAPVIVLLHGFPTSSHMFRNLIPALADRYHVIAPDYPGFGESAAPDHAAFAYTFAHYAELMDGLLSQLGVPKYAMYIMDFGAPVGFRLALRHPERVTALIVQNGNAYEEGLAPFWDPIKRYWANPTAANRQALSGVTTLPTTRSQYTSGVEDLTLIDPDNWVHDQALLDRPGNGDIQLDLLLDYRTNVAIYPQIHAYLRTWKPPTIIVWGKNDRGFLPEGAKAYLHDVPDAELHFVDSGHFALEDKLDEIVPLMRDFLERQHLQK